jgi:hypothetical protein
MPKTTQAKHLINTFMKIKRANGLLEVCIGQAVGVQVRWEGSGTEPAGEYTFLYGKGNKRVISAVKRVEFFELGIPHAQSLYYPKILFHN